MAPAAMLIKQSASTFAPWGILSTFLAGPQATADKGKKPATSVRAHYIRANYSKFEFRIPMRDGARLQSSWFPMVNRNPQRYVPNIFKAKPSDFVRATHRVYRSALHPSQLILGVQAQ